MADVNPLPALIRKQKPFSPSRFEEGAGERFASPGNAAGKKPSNEGHTQASEVSEFLESLRPGLSRALIYVVLAFVAAGLLWAWLGKVDVVATAPFRLVPLGQVNTVQGSRNGQIQAIAVKEGDRVIKGQVLFKVRSRETWAELREQEQAKVALEQASYDFRQALPQRQHLTQETVAALKARLEMTEAVMQAHQEAVNAYRTDLAGRDHADENPAGSRSDLRTEIRFRSAETEYQKQQYEDRRRLYEKGLISRRDLDEARVRYLGALAEFPSRMADIHQLETTAQELKQQIVEAQIALDREATNAAHTYEEAKLRYARAQQAVRRDLEADTDLVLSPEAGVVTQVLVNTVGQVVNNGQALVTLVPASAPVVAEALILNKDAGLVKPGQVVRLKYEAFPFGDYGIKRGKLLRVSPDAVVDPTLGAVYRGVIELEDKVVRTQGEEKPLMYGMTGIVEVVTDRKSVLSLLLRPLRQLKESATFGSDEAK